MSYLKSLKSCNSLNKFKQVRVKRWHYTNTPFNPVDSWRKRKKNLISSFKDSFWAVNGPTILLKSKNYTEGVTNIESRWNFFVPFAQNTPNGLLFKQSLSSSSKRTKEWFRVITKGLGALSFLKLRYKGKSFRWHRKKGSLVLRFGRSHMVMLKPHQGVWWKKQGRMKILFFGSNEWYLKTFLMRVVWWRPMNIYHGRGLRLSKQKVWRKGGKVSTYR